MRRLILAVCVIGILGCKQANAQLSDSGLSLIRYVNPFIGTGAVNGSSLSGNNFPGATAPFGMVQLSPDTRKAPDWSVASGYNYNDTAIYGFSHTHLSGTGVPELFDILMLPFSGPIDSYSESNQLHSLFTHKHESARPGYYQVKLQGGNINAELTATEHSGMHRYSYVPGNPARVKIDLDHSLDKGSWGCHIIDAQIRMVGDSAMEGYRIITGWAKLRKVYFYMAFSKPVIHNVMLDGSVRYPDQSVLNGTDLRSILDFGMLGQPLVIKVGISAVSKENAKHNLEQEISGWDFDNVALGAEDTWQRQLSKIIVEGTGEQKRIFYTALYHSFLQPNKMADVNGAYQAPDYTTRFARDGQYYSTFSLWDSYRAASPLYTLIEPVKTAGFVNSMLLYFKDFGYLPIWSLWGEENYCMIGNHAIPVVVNAVLNKISGIDPKEAYRAVKASALTAHPGSPYALWGKYHYMPENLQSQSVSLTLEMAYDDWCVARLAAFLGEKQDYKLFMERSENYRQLFDSSTCFFRAKNDKGNWVTPFNPLEYGANGGNPYTEGNAWQYLWYVPQNVPDLIKLIGGDQAFNAKLDRFFTLKDSSVKLNDNASGLIGQYAHGNEPSHHVAYLYDYSGVPWKAQGYVRQIMKEMYNDCSSGYAGNEDCGQMSAWYIFSAMGFYPVNPTSGIYAIGSPVLEKAVISLEGEKTFTVISHKNFSENKYIQSAKLNGKLFNHTFLTTAEIKAGGILEFFMGPKPNKKWGAGAENRPPLSVL